MRLQIAAKSLWSKVEDNFGLNDIFRLMVMFHLLLSQLVSEVQYS